MRYSAKRLEMGEDAWAEYQKQRNVEKVLAHRDRNPKSFSEKAMESRRRRKRKLIAYKGGKCERCGYDKDYPGVYEFHHLNPDEKDFGIASKSVGLEKLKLEVDKCQLLCRNCHAETHDELIKAKL